MSERPRVVVALSPLAERQMEKLLFEADAPLELTRRVVEADELLRTVSEQKPEAVLLSPELSGLTSSHCERVRANGTRLVGIALDQHEHDALNALGVDASIDTTISREELLNTVRQPGRTERPTVSLPVSPASPAPAQQQQAHEREGSVVAVLGAKGAPGASELAASLASLADRRWPTVLVETDVLGGGLAARLAADPAQGSILGLIRATQAGEGALRELVERWLIERDTWPAVLLGAPDPQALSEVAQPGAMTRALDALAGLYPVVVCDVGFLLTDPEQRPVRLHREALIAADAVLLVLGPREAQLHDGLRQLDLLLDTLGVPAERLRIIVGQVGGPSSANKGAIERTIAGHLAEHGLTVDGWLPWDARGARGAERRGRPLVFARRRGPYARAVTHLLAELFLPSAPTSRRRKRRLPVPQTAASRSEPDEVVWQG